MVATTLGILFCVGVALAVLAIVAIPARRDGRELLSSRGDDVVSALKARQEQKVRARSASRGSQENAQVGS